MILLCPLRRSRGAAVMLAASLGLAACAPARMTPPAPAPGPAPAPAAPSARAPHSIIPLPVSVELAPADSFAVTASTVVTVDASAPDAERVGRLLAEQIGPPVAAVPRLLRAGEAPPAGSIHLALRPGDAALAEEGYELRVAREGVTITARRPAGLFYGAQTLRQLFPPAVEHHAAMERSLKAPAARVLDQPRYPWRGAMLDVARHFFGVEEVKRFIDLMALYKLNRLHLHLSDDQGWRIAIHSRPNLAHHGGSTQVGGGPSGYYTQAEYAELVRYAHDRFITVVPEIDMPGHTNAALASYPELNCDGKAPPLYTGTKVGFSALCVEKESTYAFLDDVVREIAALTPGEYFHIGGDEVEKLTDEQYRRFIERAEAIVRRHGKRAIGWGEIAPAKLHPSTIVQHWRPDTASLAARHGQQVILSPASRVYLDMKYDASTVLGLRWAGLVSTRQSYEWEPASLLPNIPAAAILGVEAPLWSETVENTREIEYLTFPRLAGVAEIGWTAGPARRWDEYRLRLGAQAPRWRALGVNFYPDPVVEWEVR